MQVFFRGEELGDRRWGLGERGEERGVRREVGV